MAMTYPDCPPAYVEVDDSHLIHPAPVAAKIISENVTTVAATEEDVSNNKMATIGLILPFPQQSSDQLQGKHAKSPFFIYHPPVARLSRPEGNDKESVVHNAKRKIQYRKDVARAGTGVASKVVKVSHLAFYIAYIRETTYSPSTRVLDLRQRYPRYKDRRSRIRVAHAKQKESKRGPLELIQYKQHYVLIRLLDLSILSLELSRCRFEGRLR